MEKPSSNFFSIPEDATTSEIPLSLRCIYGHSTGTEVILFAEPKLTGITQPLVIPIKDPQPFTKDVPLPDKPKGFFFSLYLGSFELNNIPYLFFATQVIPIKFGVHVVYLIKTLVAYKKQTFFIDIDLSESLTQLLGDRFIFSYTVDLTDHCNFEEVLFEKGRPKKSNLNWLFFANRNSTSTLVRLARNWVIPVVSGNIFYKKENDLELYLILRNSIIDIYPANSEDSDALWDFYSPSSVISVDCLMSKGEQLTSLNISLNNFPKGNGDFEGKMAGDQISNQIKEEKIGRYFEFMYYFLNCKAFVFSGSIDQLKLMRSVGLSCPLLNVGLLPDRKSLYVKSKDSLSKNEEETPPLSSEEDLAKSSPKNIEHPALNSKEEIVQQPSDKESKSEGCYPYTSHENIIPVYEIIEFYEDYPEITSNEIDDIAEKVNKLISKRTSRSKLGLSICTESFPSDAFMLFQLIYVEFFEVFLKKSNCDVSKEPQCLLDALHFIEKHFMDGSNSVLNIMNKNGARKASLPKPAPSKDLLAQIFGKRSGISRWYKAITKQMEIFSSKLIQVACVTHNCSGEIPSGETLPFMKYPKIPDIANSDIIVIGLQEIVEMKSHNLGSILTAKNEKAVEQWKALFKSQFKDHTTMSSVSLLGLYLCVLVKRDRLQDLDVIVSKHELHKLRFMNLANKGALFLNLKINFDSLGVMNCHLNSGDSSKDAKKRMADLNNLYQFLEEQRGLSAGIIFGDMNFRTLNLPDSVKTMDKIERKSLKPTDKMLIHEPSVDEFELGKELYPEMKNLTELKITFSPSYKLVPYEFRYNLFKCSPAWTDRILFSTDKSALFASFIYECDSNTGFSDHYPVYLISKFMVRELNIAKFKHIFDL